MMGSLFLSNGSEVATYTDGKRHKTNVLVPERDEIHFSLKADSVLCHGGSNLKKYLDAVYEEADQRYEENYEGL